MLDIGFSEPLLLAAVALIVITPEQLPLAASALDVGTLNCVA